MEDLDLSEIAGMSPSMSTESTFITMPSCSSTPVRMSEAAEKKPCLRMSRTTHDNLRQLGGPNDRDREPGSLVTQGIIELHDAPVHGHDLPAVVLRQPVFGTDPV